MDNIHIAGTGIWHPEEMITNDEIVESYNSYVDNFNHKNADEIDNEIWLRWNIHQLHLSKKHLALKLDML